VLKPDGGELYVISTDAHGLIVVNTQTNSVGDFVLLGNSPASAALTSDAQTLYVTDAAADDVVPVLVQTREVQTPTNQWQWPRTGATPVSSVLTPGGEMLLVADSGSNDVAVIRTNIPTPVLITLIPVGTNPRDIAVKMF
jgi:YVTN family beta-propeller protein